MEADGAVPNLNVSIIKLLLYFCRSKVGLFSSKLVEEPFRLPSAVALRDVLDDVLLYLDNESFSVVLGPGKERGLS